MEIVGFDRIARYYLSHTHLEAAVRLAGLCEDAEQHWTGTYEKGMYTHLKDSKMFAIGTIISAVCFLESTVNELFADSIEPQKRLKDIAPDKLAMLGVFQNQFLKNQSGPSLLNRFQLALACICGEVFDRGTSPYQNVDLIISLRNALVHASPENISLEQESDGELNAKFAKRFSDKFAINPYLEARANAFFPDKCLGYGCARWSVISAKSFVDVFFERLGVENKYEAKLVERINRMA